MYPLHVAALPEEATLDNPSETPFVLDPADYQAHQALTLSIVKAYVNHQWLRSKVPSRDGAKWMTTEAIKLANEIFTEYVEMHGPRITLDMYDKNDSEYFEFDQAEYLLLRKLTLQLVVQHIERNFHYPENRKIAELVHDYSQAANQILSTYGESFPVPEDSIPPLDF